jgi:hypothetical protein
MEKNLKKIKNGRRQKNNDLTKNLFLIPLKFRGNPFFNFFLRGGGEINQFCLLYITSSLVNAKLHNEN